MGLREDKSPLSRPVFLLGLPSNTDTPTLEIVTCKLLLLRDLQFNNFFNSGLFTGYFFLIIKSLPLKVSDAEGS